MNELQDLAKQQAERDFQKRTKDEAGVARSSKREPDTLDEVTKMDTLRSWPHECFSIRIWTHLQECGSAAEFERDHASNACSRDYPVCVHGASCDDGDRRFPDAGGSYQQMAYKSISFNAVDSVEQKTSKNALIDYNRKLSELANNVLVLSNLLLL